MSHVIIYDCEFLTNATANRRCWFGCMDPDPLVVQIGAVKLMLDDDYRIEQRFMRLVRPIDRFGEPMLLDPFFTQFTSIEQTAVDCDGVSLSTALTELDSFADGADFWAWGKDELNMIAISCYVAGLPVPIDACRFGNASALLVRAGMPVADVMTTRSSSLSVYHGIERKGAKAHDALDDALSVALTLQHLMRQGLLTSRDFSVREMARLGQTISVG
ncbi:exonuclease [Pannonibacter sp. SL95]|uniref:exonuclease n=1 Tax=Pannonibacter sp. SL95 TaxID=2995153 RepID=UPI0022764CAF|nr:exonuclease [Pannonibacter sp. SL95]MCY1708959.1 exonuclease [Pannonibacter sp. SL95]